MNVIMKYINIYRAHTGPIWDPYGTHIEPIWAAHVGPICFAGWDIANRIDMIITNNERTNHKKHWLNRCCSPSGRKLDRVTAAICAHTGCPCGRNCSSACPGYKVGVAVIPSVSAKGDFRPDHRCEDSLWFASMLIQFNQHYNLVAWA